MSTIKDVVAQSEKTFKDSTIVTMGVNPEDPERLATGIFAFDLATGGGVPEGRVSVL